MQVAIYSRGQRKVYAFDRAFDGGCSQEQVYRDTKSLIRSVLDGEAAALTSFSCAVCHWARRMMISIHNTKSH